MAGFANARGIGKIQEERQFTNPHVRFIRKGGKIIPIINKKRIGQDTSRIGDSVTVKGLGVLAAGYAAKKLKITGKIGKFNLKKAGPIKVKPSDKFKVKAYKFAGNATIKSAKAISNLGVSTLRNYKKAGFGVVGVGVATRFLGDEMQMRSGLGKDYFFSKDIHGRYS